MSKYEITIKENGIEIKTQEVETLFDANGDPVEIPKGNHRVAIGLGDYVSDPMSATGDELTNYRVKIDSIVGDHIGKSLTTLLIGAKESSDANVLIEENYNDVVTSQKSVVDMLGDTITEVEEKQKTLTELQDKYNALVNSVPSNNE